MMLPARERNTARAQGMVRSTWTWLDRARSMSFIWFLMGALVGGGLVWVFLSRQSDLRVAEAEFRVQKELEQAQSNANDADLAHRETKERLIALQLQHDALLTRHATGQPEPSEVPLPDGAPLAAMLAQTTGPAPAGDAGDLKRVKGIGPTIERRLKELGVASLSDLAALSPAEIDRINARLDFPGRIQRERWIEQARELLGS